MTDNNETKQLAVITNDHIVRPADLSVVAETMRMFDKAKSEIIRVEDVQKIAGRDFVKKSGWRRLARAFTLNTEVRSRDIKRDNAGLIVSAEFVVRASHPNGAFAEAWGGCDSHERKFAHNQDIAAQAQTRATNRAISDLIAGGEVSAEEMEGHERFQAEQPTRKSAPAKSAKANPKLQEILFPGLAEWPPKNDKGYAISIGTSGKLTAPCSDAFRGKLRGEFASHGYGSKEDRHALMGRLYAVFEIPKLPKGNRPTTSDPKFTTGHAFFFMNILQHNNFQVKEADDPLPWETGAPEVIEGEVVKDVDSGAYDKEPIASGDVDLSEDEELDAELTQG